MTNQTSRRDFLKVATAVGAAGYFSSSQIRSSFAKSPNEQPGIGFIGTGIRFHTYHGDQGSAPRSLSGARPMWILCSWVGRIRWSLTIIANMATRW